MQDQMLGNLTTVSAPVFISYTSLGKLLLNPGLYFLILKKLSRSFLDSCSNPQVVHDLFCMFLVWNTSPLTKEKRYIFASHSFLLIHLSYVNFSMWENPRSPKKLTVCTSGERGPKAGLLFGPVSERRQRCFNIVLTTVPQRD